MIYFDNAATSFPKPERVIRKVNEVMNDYCANPGRSGHKLALKMDREIYGVREKLTNFVNGTNSLNTIFTSNCTHALNTAIQGVVEPGMHIITTSIEHNSVLRPLKQLERNNIIELSIVNADDKGIIDVSDIECEIKDNTGVIAITNMSNLVGTIVDIEAIGKILNDKDIIFIVDAAQSIGFLDIDVQKMNIDILCYPGHKSLYGPMGTGAMYIKEGIKVKSLEQGGTGSFSSDLYQPEIYPDSLESGTLNGPGIIALGEGIDFINENGLKKIRDHENLLRDIFVESLRDIENIIIYGPMDDRRGPVIPINIKNMDSSELGYILSDEYDIYIRPGLHCAPLAHKSLGTEDLGCARFSFGYFNTEEEVLKACDILKEIAKENR
ncbi:MAG: aminotransferase class V-fold PLP-dependent enzyme [Tissierellia bacterium]|nr:aminotransferase class V-fold PLP-dependent enzyme [Tissierellia bacterium]